MSRRPSYVDCARGILLQAQGELLDEFGRAALEETAFSVYTNGFPPAAYLGWSRVVHAQRLLLARADRSSALDFGSGLGVMLPFLAQHYRRVVAYDLDPRPAETMIAKLSLQNVHPRTGLQASNIDFDAIVALDVLEHVTDLDAIYGDLLTRTSARGCWVISGPTENWLYHAMRRLSRTTGEGHIRTIYDVFDAVPNEMRCAKVARLPFGSPVPLFLIALFARAD